MTFVEGTALDAAKAPIPNARIRITLLTGTTNLPGYTTAGELVGPATIKADENGAWSIDLTPTNAIDPSNTYYQVAESAGISTIQVPDTGGPYQLKDLLVTPPPTPAAPGITGLQILDGGTTVATRAKLNLIAGANTSVTAVDDPATGSVDVTIASTAPSAVTSVNGHAGAVDLTAADVQAIPATDAGVPGGVATLDVGGHIPLSQTSGLLVAGDNLSDLPDKPTARTELGLGGAAVLNVGTAANTVAAGDDARITGAIQGAGHGLTESGSTLALTSPVAAADLPAASTSAPGIVELESDAAQLQAAGVAALGPSVKPAPSTHAHPLQPWIFPITKYGAVGDLQCVTDGSVTNASNVLTSPSGKFLPAHGGQTFVVKGALANGNALIAVGTYVSATQMTLSASATATASNLQTVWGSDDTSAIQQAIDAAMAYSSPFGLAAEVFTPPTAAGYGYMIAGALKSTDGVNAVFNSQLTIKPYSDRAAKKRLAFSGAGDAGDCRHWNQDFPAFGGSTWFSACLPFTTLAQQQTGPNGVSTLGNPSVLGAPTGKAGYGVSGTNPQFSNVTVAMHDMTIMNAHSVNGWTIMPFNFHGLAGCHLDRCTYGTSGVVQYYTGSGGSGGDTDFAAINSLSSGISIGGLLPAAGNNASNRIRDCVWNGGFTYGPLFTEHTTGGGNTVLYCWSGFCPAGNYGDGGTGAGALHGIEIGQLCVEGCAYQVNVFGAAAGNKGPYVDVIIDSEGSRQLRDNPSNGTGLAALLGTIKFRGSSSAPALTFPTTCIILREENPPGVAASPPALVINTAVMNNTGRWAEVWLSGGSSLTTVQVSDLMWGAAAPAVNTRPGMDFSVGGTIPAGTKVRLAPGGWVKVNGTGTPTLPAAVWVLE